LEAGWKLIGGWLEAGWRLVGGWLEAGWKLDFACSCKAIIINAMILQTFGFVKFTSKPTFNPYHPLLHFISASTMSQSMQMEGLKQLRATMEIGQGPDTKSLSQCCLLDADV
jgi:hypothetical protein